MVFDNAHSMSKNTLLTEKIFFIVLLTQLRINIFYDDDVLKYELASLVGNLANILSFSQEKVNEYYEFLNNNCMEYIKNILEQHNKKEA